jgi:hypothetical protein
MINPQLHHQLIERLQDERRERARLERLVREARRGEPGVWLRARLRIATWLLDRGAQLLSHDSSLPSPASRHTP